MNHPLIPGQGIDTQISEGELKERLAGSASASEAKLRLVTMAKVVFADPQPVIQAVESTAVASEIGDRKVISVLRLEPEQYGPLAGKGGMFSTMQERATYRRAVAAQSGLRGVAEHYLKIVHGIRQTMQLERHEEAQRQAIEVFKPSDELMHALDRGERLSAGLIDEFRQAVAAFEHRLHDDLALLRSGKGLDKLASRHGIDQTRLEAARTVLRALDKGQARECARDRIQARAPSHRKTDVIG